MLLYGEFANDGVIELLLDYYRPYHARLTDLAESGVRLAIDCHTMGVCGRSIGPDPGAERPWICLGGAHGTCPSEWAVPHRTWFSCTPGLRFARLNVRSRRLAWNPATSFEHLARAL